MARSSTSFKKGAKRPEGAGRKKGRPNKTTEDIRALAQLHGPEAIGKLVELMRDADFETVQVAAAKELLDRGYGKSVQPVEADIDHGIRYDVLLAFGAREPAHPLTMAPEPVHQRERLNGAASEPDATQH